MINRSDVICIKMPFPDISSDLAVSSHMYICHNVDGNIVRLVKCQTLKPYMLSSSIMKHYWDESPDISRNPFKRKTRIDCDKEFVTFGVKFDDGLKTTTRPDVCNDVMLHVDSELSCDGYNSITINENELLSLNILISQI